jgi:hypothetical protein
MSKVKTPQSPLGRKHRRFLKEFHHRPLIVKSCDEEFFIRSSTGKTVKVLKYGDRFIIVKD